MEEGEINKEIVEKSNNHIKVWKYFFITIGMLIIIILLTWLIISWRHNYICNNQDSASNRIMLYELKCLSLCPIEEVSGGDNSTNHILERSCVQRCEELKENFIEKEKYYPSKLKDCKPNIENSPDFYYSCGGVMTNVLRANESREFKICLEQFFETNRKILDTDEISPGIYQKYLVNITNLSCSKNTVNFKLTSLEGSFSSFDITLFYEGNSFSVKNQTAPKLKETKEYSISPETNLSTFLNGIPTSIKIDLIIENKISYVSFLSNC